MGDGRIRLDIRYGHMSGARSGRRGGSATEDVAPSAVMAAVRIARPKPR